MGALDNGLPWSFLSFRVKSHAPSLSHLLVEPLPCVDVVVQKPFLSRYLDQLVALVLAHQLDVHRTAKLVHLSHTPCGAQVKESFEKYKITASGTRSALHGDGQGASDSLPIQCQWTSSSSNHHRIAVPHLVVEVRVEGHHLVQLRVIKRLIQVLNIILLPPFCHVEVHDFRL